jgi:hypothetical protein
MNSLLKDLSKKFITESTKKPKRWQDNDGDGKWYEPGVDVEVDEAVVIDKNADVATVKKAQDLAANSKQDLKVEEEDIEESNTSAATPGYMTKNAFAPTGQKSKKLGYSSGVAEAMDKKYEELIESYREYALGDAKMSPDQKVKTTIREVSKKLQEIEQMVQYSSRLKTESGLSRDGYGTSVNKALNKISERLIKISERVRSLGE